MALKSRVLLLSSCVLSCLFAGWPALAYQDTPSAPVATAGAPVQASVQAFDPRFTRFGFELRTRWGQRVIGMFPEYEGEVTVLPDGRHLVRIVLRTAGVTVAESERYTAMARGPSFFDSARHPMIEFESDPHPDLLIRAGGRLRGRLTMHGVSRIETFQLAPAACDRPGKDCDVVASGSISRADYGLDGWQLALTDRVRFNMRVRVIEAR
ncbi:MAG TPA: YceI family protein [Lysobacter sp.]